MSLALSLLKVAGLEKFFLRQLLSLNQSVLVTVTSLHFLSLTNIFPCTVYKLEAHCLYN